MNVASGKLHYSAGDSGKTLCGRWICDSLRMTSEPYRVTCVTCRSSYYLDGALGNMTHTGH